MVEDELNRKKRRTPYTFYSILLAAALIIAVSTIAQAANFINTDGYINLSSTCTNLSNGTCVINYNTTRYAGPTLDGILSSSDWLRFNASNGSSNGSDGNNYSVSEAFNFNGGNIVHNTERNGMSNISSFFTLTGTNGTVYNNGVIYTNATNCSSGQYSRFANGGFSCFNDASGGSGTVTSVALNSTTTAVSITGSPVTVSGTLVFEIANATTLNDGLMTAVQATSLATKALASNCVGYNSTHVNVTMNATTAGVQCVAVSLNPGSGGAFDPSGLYVNVTDLQNSNASTNTRIDDLNLSKVATGDCSTPGQFGYQFFDTNINCDYVNFSYLTSVPTYLLNYYDNISALQVFRDAVYTNTSLLQVFRDAVYVNVTALQTYRDVNYINVTDLQNSNTSTNTRIDTVNTTVQNLLTSNTSVYGLILQLGQNDTNLNNSINAVNTRATTINATTVSLATNLTTLSNTAITTFGIKEGTDNASITNSTTFHLYEGSGITINLTTTSPNPGITITSSASGDAAGTYNNISALQNLTKYNGANTSLTPPATATVLWEEFTHVTSTSAFGFLGAAAISSGTGSAIIDGEINHPGIVTASDSTTAGGGYLYRTAANAILLNQSEGFTIVLRAPGGKAGQTQISAGFTDTATTILGNVDGCFFAYNLTQENRNTIMGRCRTNSVETNTSTNYTATNNTWYVMKGWLNASGTGMNFSLYNGTGVLLWSDNVSTNIPTNSVNLFRQTGIGVVATQNTTDAASVILNLDYVSYTVNRTLSRY